jgi:BirA family transcriptional regulator, biotin operon repressor / biotin---[acetyl-CoA-carboxylase] ligase
MSPCDRLSIPTLRRHLDTKIIGRHIYLFGAVHSTNAVLRRLAAGGAAEGTVVMAEALAAGRGRPGVRWFSPEGVNLYVSALFRAELAPHDVALFATIGALALSQAIAMEGLDAGIKWPNDVVVEGRKVGGVLAEYAADGGRVSHVILGIGVNLNVTRAELDAALGADADGATSLGEALGFDVDRNLFTARLLSLLEAWYGVFRRHGLSALVAAWQARDALRGRRLEVRAEAASWRGRGRGIDADGRLVVEDAAGHAHRLVAGGVRLLDRDDQEDS